MTHEDIDMHISRKRMFTKTEVFEMETHILAETFLTASGYYFSDRRNSGKKPNLPYGYYLGLKTVHCGREWTIDLWFMSDAEKRRRRHERIDMRDVKLTTAQKATMMRCKRHLGKIGIRLWGQKVYEAVLLDGVTTAAEFKKWLRTQEIK